jgi:hypothetical protein
MQSSSSSSSLQKTIAASRRANSSPHTESEEPDDWKAALAATLPLYDASPFVQLISDYLTKELKPDLSDVVGACMTNGEVGMLSKILANGDTTSLCIRGPVDEQGLQTLVKAMPDSLPVQKLALEKLTLNAFKAELLFNEIVGRMHGLENLSLREVRYKASHFFKLSDFRLLPCLVTLDVVVKQGPNADLYPLLKKILKTCQVRSLSIEEFGAISTVGHGKLAEALGHQTKLDSLRLKIVGHKAKKHFECYMPFLCRGKTPLLALDLSDCCIRLPIFNELIEALPKNQPTLELLILSHCSPMPDLKDKNRGVSINILPLAQMHNLRHLDLSKMGLQERITVKFLEELEKRPNRIESLNLDGNWAGPRSMAVMTGLLKENNTTLVFLSFEPLTIQSCLGYTDEVLAQLTEAVQHNTSLLTLHIRWEEVPSFYRDSMTSALDRNTDAAQRAIVKAATHAAATFTMPLLLNSPLPWEIVQSPQLPQLPEDMMLHIIDQGLTKQDVLNFSSINTEALKSREEFLRKTGS